ncbi:hypothetical protein Taro_019033, partial [Colocasia esculenta]|nr:hypothetical protein [Colocasia esculenta]
DAQDGLIETLHAQLVGMEVQLAEARETLAILCTEQATLRVPPRTAELQGAITHVTLAGAEVAELMEQLSELRTQASQRDPDLPCEAAELRLVLAVERQEHECEHSQWEQECERLSQEHAMREGHASTHSASFIVTSSEYYRNVQEGRGAQQSTDSCTSMRPPPPCSTSDLGEAESSQRHQPAESGGESTQASSHKELLSSGRPEGRKKVYTNFSRTAENVTDKGDTTRIRILNRHRHISTIASVFDVAIPGRVLGAPELDVTSTDPTPLRPQAIHFSEPSYLPAWEVQPKSPPMSSFYQAEPVHPPRERSYSMEQPRSLVPTHHVTSPSDFLVEWATMKKELHDLRGEIDPRMVAEDFVYESAPHKYDRHLMAYLFMKSLDVDEKIKSDEEFSVYADRWRSLAAKVRCPMPEEEKVKLLISNATPTYRAILAMNDITTMHQLYSRARFIQTQLKDSPIHSMFETPKSCYPKKPQGPVTEGIQTNEHVGAVNNPQGPVGRPPYTQQPQCNIPCYPDQSPSIKGGDTGLISGELKLGSSMEAWEEGCAAFVVAILMATRGLSPSQTEKGLCHLLSRVLLQAAGFARVVDFGSSRGKRWDNDVVVCGVLLAETGETSQQFPPRRSEETGPQ